MDVLRLEARGLAAMLNFNVITAMICAMLAIPAIAAWWTICYSTSIPCNQGAPSLRITREF